MNLITRRENGGDFHCDCLRSFDITFSESHHRAYSAARAAARELGWTIHDEHQPPICICPICAQEMAVVPL